MRTVILSSTLLAAGVALACVACSGSEEARRVSVPVSTDGTSLEVVKNDLGYAIELTSAAVVVDDLKFTIAGEAHVSLLGTLLDSVVPSAHAHPGHYQGGEVTGELPGHFVLHFMREGASFVGDAALLVGQYRSADMTLSRASEDDVPAEDPLLGHTALLFGTASANGVEIDFQVVVDSPEDRSLVGIPFDAKVDERTGSLVLRLLTRDPQEQDSLFDGIDFALLDTDTDGHVVIDPTTTDLDTRDAYNRFRRTFQTHDHFIVEPKPR